MPATSRTHLYAWPHHEAWRLRHMEWGIGVDASLQLSFAESRALVNEAVAMGYTSAWTPSGPPTRDGFQISAQWATATEAVTGTAVQTGLAVIPVASWTPSALAQQAGTL